MKIGEFFEKHVQWIAVGLGVAWLLWVGWAYGVNRPEIEVAGQKFSAGSIDEYIRETEMQPLAAKVANPNIPAGLVDVPDFTDAFVSSMNGQAPRPLTAIVIRSDPPYQQSVKIVDDGRPRERVIAIKLPEVAVPTDLTSGSGRSLVMVLPPAPVRILNANNPDNPNAARPNIFDGAVAQPAAAGAAVAGQPVGVQSDKVWVTQFAKLNLTAQDKFFAEAKIPPSLMQKMYIEVQMQRQEVMPDGTFGQIEMVKGLPMNQPPVDRKAVTDYIKWSADPEAQKLILIPKFYEVVKGAAWEIPHKADVPLVADNQQPADNFNLMQKYQDYKALKTPAEIKKFNDSMTPEQKRAFYNFRIDEEKKEQKLKNPPPGGKAPPVRENRALPPRRGEGDAIDPQLLREMFADGDPAIDARRRRLMTNEGEGAYSRRRNRYDTEGMQPLQPQQSQQQLLGSIVPDALGNIDIWAHDETAQPGRTYRYRLRAVIYNPLFNTANTAVDPKMNLVPYLPGDLATAALDMEKSWSDWSKSVAIPTNLDMMLVSAQSLNGREVARFRVKRFQEGTFNEAPKAFEVAPGDTIGGLEKVVGIKAPVDFTTNWTLVDIRQAGGDYRVRIMDPQGRMEMRTLAGDRLRFKDDAAPKPVAAGQVGMVRQP
jgi:hypothetical protein